MTVLINGVKVILVRELSNKVFSNNTIVIESHTVKSSGEKETRFENLVSLFQTPSLLRSIEDIKKSDKVGAVIIDNIDEVGLVVKHIKKLNQKYINSLKESLKTGTSRIDNIRLEERIEKRQEKFTVKFSESLKG